jgi:hypothetical protein
MWRITRTRRAASVIIELFGPLREIDCGVVREEGRRLLDFAAPGADHEIRFAPIT